MLTNTELATKLTNYRIKNKLYQKDIAKQIGISLVTVVKIEKLEKITPRIKIIVENFLKEKGEI